LKQLFSVALVAEESKRTPIYTRRGDGGTTGMLFGGRLPKDHPQVELNGAVDETQAHLGVVRALAGDELAEICLHLERDLWVLMAEVATLPEHRAKLNPGSTLVTQTMVESLERLIDRISERFEPLRDFVLPGQSHIAAELDVARTVCRRAERLAVRFVAQAPSSRVGAYLNRLSDALWTLARWQEGEHLRAKDLPPEA
jgi:cob(I)alamin adenosyltransferase